MTIIDNDNYYSSLPFPKNQLSQNNHRLNDLLKLSDTHFIEFKSEEIFLNMNYIEDYDEAIEHFDTI